MSRRHSRFWMLAVIGDLLLVGAWPGQPPIFYALGGLVVGAIADVLASR